MNIEKDHVFVVVKASGVAKTYTVGTHYFSILRDISEEYGSAGGGWDRPVMLLMDGKVVVEKGLADVAWDYGKFAREARKAAEDHIREKFFPEWLK